MEGMPYYYQVPGRSRYYGPPPWRRNGVIQSPYEAEEIDPMTEPYAAYYNGSHGPYAPHHVASRRGRQVKPAGPPRAARAPTGGAQPDIRQIVVKDGNTDWRKQEKSSIETRHDVPEFEVANQAEPKRETKQDIQQKQAPRQPRFESQAAAANCIQRRYRGHQVRKTDPLKQLRILKEVQDRLKEFQQRACDPEFMRRAREDKMERLRFDEGLMKEVLKLDSLQEVHPFVRDVRKARARDLVRLQDATDAALASGRAINPVELQCEHASPLAN